MSSMQGKVDNIIRIPATLERTFFRYWLEFLKPIHNLTDREMQVAATFLRKRHELSKKIKDEDILDKVVLGEDTRREVREECTLSLPHFQVIIGKLRKGKFLDNNKINPRFIPNLNEEKGVFHLLLHFELS